MTTWRLHDAKPEPTVPALTEDELWGGYAPIVERGRPCACCKANAPRGCLVAREEAYTGPCGTLGCTCDGLAIEAGRCEGCS
jgi:hypothetical protein